MTPRSTLRVILIAVGITMFLIGLIQAATVAIGLMAFRRQFDGWSEFDGLTQINQSLWALFVPPGLTAVIGFTLALYAHVPARWFCSEPLPESY